MFLDNQQFNAGFNAAQSELYHIDQQLIEGLITEKEYWSKVVSVAAIQFEKLINEKGD